MAPSCATGCGAGSRRAAWPLTAGTAGLDVVVRALPAAADASWQAIAGEVEDAVSTLAARVR